MRFLRRGTYGAVALVVGLQASTVLAQTDEQRAGARAAATQGAKAYQQGHWQEAIDLFTRAQSLVHAPPHLLYLARANAKLGHFVTAQELYLKIVHDSLPADAPAAFRQAQQTAASEVKEVEAKIAHLSIKVDGARDTTVIVTIDGKPVPPALVGIALPIDPGAHQVKAAAAGFKPAEQSVKLDPAANQAVALTLVAEPNAAAAADASPTDTAPATPAASTAAPPPSTGDQGTSHGGSNGMRIGSYVALGVGVVGLGLGTVFVLKSSSKRKDADAAFAACGSPCLDSNPKSAEVASLDDEATSAKTLATVGFVVGGVGLATGVTLFILSNKKHGDEQARSPEVHPWVGLRSAGVTGTF